MLQAIGRLFRKREQYAWMSDREAREAMPNALEMRWRLLKALSQGKDEKGLNKVANQIHKMSDKQVKRFYVNYVWNREGEVL